MEILEFGDRNKRKIIFIHGFNVLIKYGKNISNIIKKTITLLFL